MMLDFSNIAEEWEAQAPLRRRASKGKSLMVSTVKDVPQVLGNIKNVAENSDVLMPLIKRMAAAGILETPSVETLGPMVLEFYALAGTRILRGHLLLPTKMLGASSDASRLCEGNGQGRRCPRTVGKC